MVRSDEIISYFKLINQFHWGCVLNRKLFVLKNVLTAGRMGRRNHI